MTEVANEERGHALLPYLRAHKRSLCPLGSFSGSRSGRNSQRQADTLTPDTRYPTPISVVEPVGMLRRIIHPWT